MIKDIEIICKPCHKCEVLEERVKFIIGCIEQKNRVKIPYTFKHITELQAGEKYGYNVAQYPLLVVNGNVESVGHIKEEHVIRMKLEEINKEG